MVVFESSSFRSDIVSSLDYVPYMNTDKASNWTVKNYTFNFEAQKVENVKKKIPQTMMSRNT
jgi:hypothetical protein